jgi:peptidoglycan hydrolase CwlO-like protein
MKLENLGKAIVNLESVDIEAELSAHGELQKWVDNDTKIRNLNKQKATLESAVGQAEKSLAKYTKELESLANKTCHA